MIVEARRLHSCNWRDLRMLRDAQRKQSDIFRMRNAWLLVPATLESRPQLSLDALDNTRTDRSTTLP